jgi:outer membrane protein OmpA-like peptidoglycan-associated protein
VIRNLRASRMGGLAALACLLLGVSGCTLVHQKQAAPGVMITEPTVSSALVAVVDGPMTGVSLARLVAATARPGESVDVLRAGTPQVVAAASSPSPARVVVSGRPARPGTEATSFQWGEYRRSVASWQDEVTGATKDVATRTSTALAVWASKLDIAGKVGRIPGLSPASGGLPQECDVASSALAGLSEVLGASVGGRRVVLLYASSLSDTLPPGELTGDDVIVVTSSLPSAAEVSAAQASLLAAGATRASILGPETTTAQLWQLVTVGLSREVETESLSGAALFANNSARLTSGAARVLTPLIAPLREAGAAAVINGYASTPGSSEANYLLSYARATAVASFLEAHGIAASALEIIGHGASDLVAAGPSGANRRVVVVIEEPD